MALCCPKTFTGFCLEDNTPIAVTINNGVLVSWTNLVTGVVTPGNPPAGTGVCEAAVTVEIPPVVVAPLTCDKDEVTVCQGTSPWVVSGTVSVTEPVTVDAVDFDIRNLTFATDKVDASGSVVALDAATLAALETITVLQGTSPWVVTGTLSSSPLTCETDSITVCPPISGSFDVNVVNQIDISPLTCETDSITVCPPVSGFAVDDAQSNNRFEPGVRTTTAVAISSIGNNTIITPTAGMRLRVFWIGMSTSEVGLETLAIVKFGAAGAAKYRWFLGAPGAFSHWEAIEGGTNESLIANLSVGATVQVNVTYEEFV